MRQGNEMQQGPGESTMQQDNRHRLATMAHATAHEVVALRAVVEMIQPDTTVAEVLAKVNRMIDAREQRVALMGARVVGHA